MELKPFRPAQKGQAGFKLYNKQLRASSLNGQFIPGVPAMNRCFIYSAPFNMLTPHHFNIPPPPKKTVHLPWSSNQQSNSCHLLFPTCSKVLFSILVDCWCDLFLYRKLKFLSLAKQEESLMKRPKDRYQSNCQQDQQGEHGWAHGEETRGRKK